MKQNMSKPAVASTRLSLYLFKWKHVGEHIVMAHGLVTTSKDGQHLCVRGHQQLHDKRKNQNLTVTTTSYDLEETLETNLGRDCWGCCRPHACDDLAIHDLQDGDVWR